MAAAVNDRRDADAAQVARQAMRKMGVSARAMNVDHSLEAVRLRVALEPLGVRKADGITTIPLVVREETSFACPP
jgi:hypothetical protein